MVRPAHDARPARDCGPLCFAGRRRRWAPTAQHHRRRNDGLTVGCPRRVVARRRRANPRPGSLGCSTGDADGRAVAAGAGLLPRDRHRSLLPPGPDLHARLPQPRRHPGDDRPDDLRSCRYVGKGSGMMLSEAERLGAFAVLASAERRWRMRFGAREPRRAASVIVWRCAAAGCRAAGGPASRSSGCC